MKLSIAKQYLLPTMLLLGLIPSLLWAANPNPVNNNFATLNDDGGGAVSWSIDPSVSYGKIKLTLVGGDTRIEEIYFDDPQTDPLADGTYKYELTLIPSVSAEALAELKAAREAGGQEVAAVAKALRAGGQIPNQRGVQSGVFTIDGGELVPALAE